MPLLDLGVTPAEKDHQCQQDLSPLHGTDDWRVKQVPADNICGSLNHQQKQHHRSYGVEYSVYIVDYFFEYPEFVTRRHNKLTFYQV